MDEDARNLFIKHTLRKPTAAMSSKQWAILRMAATNAYNNLTPHEREGWQRAALLGVYDGPSREPLGFRFYRKRFYPDSFDDEEKLEYRQAKYKFYTLSDSSIRTLRVREKINEKLLRGLPMTEADTEFLTNSMILSNATIPRRLPIRSEAGTPLLDTVGMDSTRRGAHCRPSLVTRQLVFKRLAYVADVSWAVNTKVFTHSDINVLFSNTKNASDTDWVRTPSGYDHKYVIAVFENQLFGVLKQAKLPVLITIAIDWDKSPDQHSIAAVWHPHLYLFQILQSYWSYDGPSVKASIQKVLHKKVSAHAKVDIYPDTTDPRFQLQEHDHIYADVGQCIDWTFVLLSAYCRSGLPWRFVASSYTRAKMAKELNKLYKYLTNVSESLSTYNDELRVAGVLYGGALQDNERSVV